MKIRTGFVSNSSSSSFIVASEKGDPKLTVTVTIDIERQCTVVSSVEELKNHLDPEDDYYQQCVAALEKGKVLKFFRTSSDDSDDPLYAIHGRTLKPTELSGNAEIIQNGSY